MIKISKYPLETNRLILRSWQLDDVDDFFEYASVDGVGEMAGWPHHVDISTSLMVLKNFIVQDNVYAIEEKTSNKVIGSFGIHKSWASKDEELKVIEIGYVLAKSNWGQGFIPEVVEEIIRACFEKWNLDAVSVSHFDGNEQSKRVIEKSGFKYVDTTDTTLEQLDHKKVILHRYLMYK